MSWWGRGAELLERTVESRGNRFYLQVFQSPPGRCKRSWNDNEGDSHCKQKQAFCRKEGSA